MAAKLQKFAVVIAALATGVAAQPNHAVAGLGRQLIRTVTYGLQPNIGTVQNGPSFNQNSFTQRFSKNYLTQGQSYEFERFFGADSFGNPDTINTGLLDIQLGSPPGSGLLGAGVYNRVGYNLRVIPEVYWDTRTTGRNASSFVGSSSIPAPLQYHIDANNGAERYVLDGNILLNSTGSVNMFGFYNVQMSANNTGTLESSGALDNRTQDISFDIGPVNLSGNIFIDLALAGLKQIGPQLGLPTESLPGGVTARARTADEISRAIAAGQTVSAPELQTLLAAYFSDPNSVTLPASTTDNANNPLVPVPEPGTAGLLLLGGVLVGSLGIRRRRHS